MNCYTFEHISATTGGFGVSTLIVSAKNCDIILWIFPDWKIVGRFIIPQVHFPDQEILVDIRWKQRLIVTRLHRTINEQEHCLVYRVYSTTNTGLRLITTLKVPLEHFEHHLLLFTNSNETTTSTGQQQDRQQLRIVGVDKNIQFPWFISYDYEQSEEEHVKTPLLVEQATK
jgi:hypothetical protein